MKKTSTRLADGRELIYYDLDDTAGKLVRDAVDRRPLDPIGTASEVRADPLLGDAVAIASHRQGRTYHPPADQCPLDPTRGERLTEIPACDYDVVVFENRFPSLSGDTGRCEVVCFTADHGASFADLDEPHARLVLDAWTDRTAELARHPAVRQVYPFENRGEEIGVTLAHPHGQIYGYPFATPRTALMLRSAAAHKATTSGGNLFDLVVDGERAAGERIVLEGEHWTAFVPFSAHWPYEVHLYPLRRVPDLTALDEEQRAEFPGIYLELLRRFDRLFGPGAGRTPYISGWHQAPFLTPEEYAAYGPGTGEPLTREDFALHLELFTIRRTENKLKFLAGSESGMNVFINDVPPERAAERLREVASS
ncbi:galactose-1-phosphate uridylyltransferase [Streptomyces sp. NPDC049954]|uniref:galactose-1-phosphate uridylyltransferase n=1 Tax=Streptomyces sp. NPDC049954 TaxID=3155779 RepID=UPI003441C7AB